MSNKPISNLLKQDIIPLVRSHDRIVVGEEQVQEMRKNSKAVAMVGFSSRHCRLTPFYNPEIEIWGLNRLHQQEWFKYADRMFQLHPLKYIQKCIGISAGDREHYEWLTQPHEFKLYCQKAYKEFPSAIEYPIKKMRAKYGDFYTSTLAYMIALALDEGFNHFELYGFDMEADTEYKYQRDSAEYFIGLAEGMGCTVLLPQNCSLLKGDLGIYAYETSEVGFRQLLEGRAIQLNLQNTNASSAYNSIMGKKRKIDELAKTYPDLVPMTDTIELEINNQAGLLNTIAGAMAENEESIKLFDMHYNHSGVEIERAKSEELNEPVKLAEFEVTSGT